MPQDPNLYGQRPAKKPKKEIPLSTSLAFTSQLASLISSNSASSTTASASYGRPRPSKSRDDIFSIKTKRKPGKGKSRDEGDDDDHHDDERSDNKKKLKLKEVHGTEEEKQDFARARRRMEEKARLYAAMKRGDYIAKENESAPLVDFDRKWAEKHPEDEGGKEDGSSSSGSDNESDDDNNDHNNTELIEYQDEFGRTRRGTRAEVSRLQRRRARIALATSELERMSARPQPEPGRIIYGDVVQDAAFDPEASTRARMASLAEGRDRSPTPPADAHFDGGAEIRTKGVGFYQFSREDAAQREREMESLARERQETERVRAERAAGREARRREIEERRKKIGERRAERLADSFLDGLAGEMGIGAAGDTGKPGEGLTGEGAKEGSGEKEKDKGETATRG
ncbi:hypothetical protein F4810DRAFT_237023 [Camillea tinctor]|nr:hypothetical protein F4810DRAFT_237023 [Camillea tinctor]